MTRRFRLAVMRIRHDTTVATVADDVCRHFAIHADDESAVVDYWKSTSRQYLDIEATMFPWWDVTLPDRAPRETSVDAALNAARAHHIDLDQYDGFFVLVLPGFTMVANPQAGQPGQPATIVANFDGGATGSSCAIPMAPSDHTFACHELGHVLGYQHSWGVPNNGTDWDGVAPFTVAAEYGDPFDIMSSATFGSRWLDASAAHWFGDPTFSRIDIGTRLPGWPNPSAWNSMGPELARAQLWFRDPDAIRDVVEVQVRPSAGWNGGAVLTSTGWGSSSPAKELLVLRPPGSSEAGTVDPLGTYYVEFRRGDGWDRGMPTSGSDLARRGVVVHQKRDNGSGGTVIWYVGHIDVPVELDADVVSPAGDLIVSATDLPESSQVNVRLTHVADRHVSLHVAAQSSSQQVVGHHPQLVHYLCGDGTFDLQDVDITVSMTYAAESRGFGGVSTPDASAPPVLAWTVGGTGVSPSGSGTLMATAVGGRSVSVNWVADSEAATLQVTALPTAGAFDLSVTATVSEADGSNARTSAAMIFHAVGTVQRYEDAYAQALRRCMEHFILRFKPKLPPWPGPDPIEELVIDEIRALELEHLLATIAKSRADLADGLTTLVASLRESGAGRVGRKR